MTDTRVKLFESVDPAFMVQLRDDPGLFMKPLGLEGPDPSQCPGEPISSRAYCKIFSPPRPQDRKPKSEQCSVG